ncbi:response regulator [Aquimarina sp. AU474]|uniref:response regulator n=1 Tax=Aquimarina sp. AU474 TaxID=2108529 RepID=UPI000D685A19|nr:response regulator [Aquimarina sp. AU474]
MKGIIKCILLINEDRSHNFLNQYRLLKYCELGNIQKVASGVEALEYLKKVKQNPTLKPDLILLNTHMPSMNGVEFLTKFTALDIKIIRNIKIIMLADSKNKNESKKTLQHRHVIDVIQKPLTPDKVDDLFRKHFFIELGG